ncbi:MAG: peptidase dimerization domain-containing protein, partial [Bacteroidetes bacterium]|nr:peptidase dimerization domain-containing protein [Bacteroidota bacterium]
MNLAFGHIYNAGIAVRRLKITARTGGGHSWIHFGRPSAIHAIMQLGNRISHMKVSESPRTTFNIGIIEGGQSINTIAAAASMWLDLRSTEPDSLLMLEETV